MAAKEKAIENNQYITRIRIMVIAAIFGVIGLILLVSSSAASTVQLTLSASDNALRQNEEVVVNIEMDTAGQDVVSIVTELNYDHTVLEFVDYDSDGFIVNYIKVGGALNSNGDVLHPDIPEGMIEVILSNTPDNPVQGTVDLIDVTLRAKSGASANSSMNLTGNTIVDGSGTAENLFQSANTIQVAVDNVAPTVSVTSPAENATVSGDTTFSFNVNDNIAIERLDVSIDNVLVESTTSEPFGFIYDTTTLSDGAHIVSAVAYDTAGNMTATSDRTFNVSSSAPTGTVTSPNFNSTVTGTTTLAVNVTSNGPIRDVRFLIDDNLIGTATSAPYEISWDSTTVADGVYTLQALIADENSTSVGSATVNFIVDNSSTNPVGSVAITAPSNGQDVSGDVDVNIALTDISDVQSVALLANETVVATSTSAPYTMQWDSSLSPTNVAVALTVQVTTSDSSVFTSPSISVTPQNLINADVDKDGVVDLVDLSILISPNNWQKQNPQNPRADINGDGIVGLLDLSRLFSRWSQ